MARPEKGSLEGIDTSIKIEFMFNPATYAIRKNNSWNAQKTKGKNVAPLEFGGGGNREITLELLFDSYEKGSSIEKYMKDLWKLMFIDEQKKDANTKKGAPPKCRLQLGKWLPDFTCVITSMNQDYSMFLPDGTPVRATVRLTLQETAPSTAGPNPTSRGLIGSRAWTVKPGERLDWIAYRAYGESKMWRLIAEENGITDPRSVKAGTVLSLPRL
jgi:nucleoid-associated protein YgaU